jgi:dTDP-4-dehydrorhamnose reductase
MKKILITGCNGLLGQWLVQDLLGRGYEVVGVSKGAGRLQPAERFSYYEADITDDFGIQQILEKEKPHTIVHAAAVTQPDECQLNREHCEAVNVRATAQLLLSAEEHSSHFIYLSTDFVFDGEKGNYAEDDAMNPVNWYGFTKVQAEGIVETSTIPFAIIRTCLVYGKALNGTRNNIITWVRNSLAEGKLIKVVNDQWRTPTYVEDLVKGVILIIEKEATGSFHIAGSDRVTPYDMALATAAICGLNNALIEKVDASVFSQPAKRPPQTGLDISKARRELGFEPLGLVQGLQRMLGI